MKWQFHAHIGVVCAAVLLAAPAPARAEPSSGTGISLSQVEQAYAEVDYERTRELASGALRQGGNDSTATGRLYLRWAVAAAALDRADEARTAFRHALAANPQLKLERMLSPKIRAPYLEARGALSGVEGERPLELSVRRRGQRLELALHDALHVASAVELATRTAAQSTFVHRRLSANSAQSVSIAPGAQLQYFARVLDGYGNVLLDLGSADEPHELSLIRAASERSANDIRSQATPIPYHITAATLAVLGAAAGGLAAVMYLRREDAAREWNGPDCERPGGSRAAQCAEVDERRQRAESLAIGFAAASGSLLAGSVVTLVLAPAWPKARVQMGAGPRDVMLKLCGSL